MAGIETYLEQIENAVYGKDVRQAIHDGIEACYQDGKAGSIDLVARQQIAELVAPTGEAPSAAEVTDARVGDDGEIYDTLGLAIRTQFADVKSDISKVLGGSYNVLNTKWENARIDNGTYIPVTSGKQFFSSPDKFSLNGNTKIVISGENSTNSVLYVHFYNSSGTWLSRQTHEITTIANGWEITVPENAAKFQIHAYCRDSSVAWESMVPTHFMATLGEGVKEYISPQVLSNSAGAQYMKNIKVHSLVWAHTNASSAAYTPYNLSTPIDKKIYCDSDELVLTFPTDMKVAVRTYGNQYDAVSDYIDQTSWLRSPAVIENVSGKWARIVLRFATDYTEITLADAQNTKAYLVHNFPHLPEDSRIDDAIDRAFAESSTIYKSTAHRGSPLIAPECTAPSYILARKRGFKVAENDVFISSDGEYVMWHDPDLHKLGNMYDINGYEMYIDNGNVIWKDSATSNYYTYNGSTYVAYTPSGSQVRCAGANYSVEDFPLSVLKRIDFGRWKGGEFAGTQILTFDEWVFLCKRLGMELYVDRKITYTSAILQDLVDSLNKYGMLEHATFIGGLTPSTIHLLLDIVPNARFGVLAYPTAENMANFEAVGARDNIFWNVNGKELTAENKAIVRNAVARGYEVEMWYVDTDLTKSALFEVIRDACSYGINGVSTDFYRMDEALMENL